MKQKEEKVGEIGLIILIHVWFLSISVAAENKTCMLSSCGDIQIRNPFRLQGDLTGCGDPKYELVCKNNLTILNGKYYVKGISYHNYTIRLVVPGIENRTCFSTPLCSLTIYDVIYQYDLQGYNTIVLMNCSRPIRDRNYIPITLCNTSKNSSSFSSQTYAYALVGDSKKVTDLSYSCTLGPTVITGNFRTVSGPPSRSMSDLQQSLLMGLELSFLGFRCNECFVKGESCSKKFSHNTIQCIKWKTKKNCEFSCPKQKKKSELCNSL